MKLFFTLATKKWHLSLFACLLLSFLCAERLDAQTTNTQNFEGNTVAPWTSSGSNGTYLFTTGAGSYPTQSPHGGSFQLEWESFDAASGAAQTLYSPVVDYSTRGSNTPTITFWFYRDVTAYTGSSYSSEGVSVYVSTSTSGGTLLGFIPRDGTSAMSGSYIASGTSVPNATGWYQYTFNVPAGYNGATNYILLNFYSQYGDNCYLDDLSYISYPASGVYGCYAASGSWGYNFATVTPTCSNQTYNLPSTGNVEFYAAGNTQYNFSCSGSGWVGNDITMYYWTGSTWALYTYSSTGTLNLTPAANWYLVMVTDGTTCWSSWSTNSAVLTYSIPTAYTPSISESASEICAGSNVTYTAGGSGVGTFDYFSYQWDGTGGAWNTGWVTSTPYTWGSGSNGGHTLYVRATANNGGCMANSSVVGVQIDAASNAGSWGTNPLYACYSNGTTYNSAGTAVAQTITGYTGYITGWSFGNSTTCTPAANPNGWPSNAGNATIPWGCCFDAPGDATEFLVGVTNGVCPTAYMCMSPTYNTLTNPTAGSVTGSISGNATGCQSAGNITLACTGGNTGALTGGYFQWYSGSCNGTAVGTGSSLTIAAPATTTSYYVSAADKCGYSGTCYGPITYTVTPTASIASVTGSSALCVGASATYTANTVVLGGGSGSWSSTNTAVATVNSSGVATAVGAGSCNIKYTITGGCNGTPSAQAALTVTALPVVSINAPTSFCSNATTTLNPGSGGTWVSNNTSVATVSGNTVSGATAGGSTTFTFTSSTAPNCANTTSAITVTPLPTVYGVTGGGTFCLGSGSAVGLSGSQTGVNYQLVLNGSTNVGSPVAGTGGVISFGNQSTVGTYTVTATTTTNSCGQAMSGNAVVTELSPNVTNNPGASGIGTNGATLNGTD